MALDEVGPLNEQTTFGGEDGDEPICLQGYKAFCCSSGDPQPGACFGTCEYLTILLAACRLREKVYLNSISLF